MPLITVSARDLHHYHGRPVKDAKSLTDLRTLEHTTHWVKPDDEWIEVSYRGYDAVAYDPDVPFTVHVPGDPYFTN